MSDLSQKKRETFHKTQYRGLVYRQTSRGRTYYGYVPGRGRVRLASTTPRAAADEYADLRGRTAKGEKIAPANIRFGDVAEAWLENKNGRLREWTRRGYRASLDNELIPRFGHRKLREIGFEDVLKFVRTLESRGLSSSTIDSHLLPMNGTFRFARKLGYVSQNPMDLLDASDRKQRTERETGHVWSDKEIEALLAASNAEAQKKEARYDYSPLLRTAIYTGLRLGELLGLQWQDVDLEKGTLTVRRQWARTNENADPKTNAAKRRLPLSKDMIALLKELKAKSFAKGYAKLEDPVFASRSGTPLSHRNVQRRGFEPARDKAGIKGVTFHSLRHAFASRMIQKGINPVTLAHLMGHEDARITLARYAHLYDQEGTDELVREAMSS